MVTFELVSAQEVTINGVGLLKAEEPKEVDQEMFDHFRAEHGYSLTKANFPSSVKLTAVLTKNEDNEKSEEV